MTGDKKVVDLMAALEESLAAAKAAQPEAPMPVTAYLCPRCDTPYRYEDEAEQCCQGTAA